MGRSDPTGGEDVGVTIPQRIQRFHDCRFVVRNDADFLEIDPDHRQVFGDIADVLVLRAAGQDFVTDHQNSRGDDLGRLGVVHGTILRRILCHDGFRRFPNTLVPCTRGGWCRLAPRSRLHRLFLRASTTRVRPIPPHAAARNRPSVQSPALGDSRSRPRCDRCRKAARPPGAEPITLYYRSIWRRVPII